MKICRITNTAFALRWQLNDTISTILDEGHELSLVCSPGLGAQELERYKKAKIVFVHMERGIALFKDLRSLIALWWSFRCTRPDIVHSTTFKAGMLVALAAWMARVPIRMHTFTGQVWIFRKGPLRIFLKMCDRLILMLNTKCYADSQSQANFLLQERVCKPEQIRILGAGSLAGVNTGEFSLSRWPDYDRKKLRGELSIPQHAVVVNCTGRIGIEKGFKELTQAFQELSTKRSDLYWLVVGPFESGYNEIPLEINKYLKSNPRVRLLGYRQDVRPYLAISDIFCIPSYREGFGTVAIEAAAMNLPVIATKTVGLVDAVEDGETGLLVPIKDVSALKQALERLIIDEAFRRKLGAQGRKRVLEKFDQKILNRLILNEYQKYASQI